MSQPTHTPPPYVQQDSISSQPNTTAMNSTPVNEKSAAATYTSGSNAQNPAQQVLSQHEVPFDQVQGQASQAPNQPQAEHISKSYQDAQQQNNYGMAVPLRALEKSPAVVDCPVCGQRDMTVTSRQSGSTTHCSAFLCCICLCLGCIPYLFGEFKDTLHKCGRCDAHLALWHRSGRTEVLVRTPK